QVSINFNLHRFRLILQDTLGSQYLFYLRCTNAKGNGSKCTVRGGMAIAAYNGLARNGNPQFGTNDMNNALVRMAEPIQFYSKIGTVLSKCFHLSAAEYLRDRKMLIFGGYIMIGRGVRFFGSEYGDISVPQPVKGLRTRYFMNEMSIDI